MTPPRKTDENATLRNLQKKYGSELRKALHEEQAQEGFLSTKDYEAFKAAYTPRHHTIYEQGCKIAEKLLHLKPDKNKRKSIQEAINTCHLTITPEGATSFAILAPLLFVFLTTILTFITPLLVWGSASIFFIIVAVIAALLMMYGLMNLPFILADSWRSKASNQMVLCIFYIVTYMRHTSNLERAIDFAGEHLGPPLALDMKKIIWDVETEHYSSIKESLDAYLLKWRNTNLEFVESMHLIESSLAESSEDRRLNALDKALKVMLDETYERMLHYAHGLKGPITTLHMLGIILPILGLVILPLIVSFIPEVRWWHLMTLYNIVLPILVFLLAKEILSKRPSGYGGSSTNINDPSFQRMIRVAIGKKPLQTSPLFTSVLLFLFFFFIGTTPLLLHALNPTGDVIFTREGTIKPINTLSSEDATFYLLGYRPELVGGEETGRLVGPYGLGATLLSLLIPLSFGIGFGYYFKKKSDLFIKIRERVKKLEQEFASALFQLGNRLGDGLPAEIAFERVAEVMQETETGKFFAITTENIRKLGYGIEEAIFDPEVGSINYFPSSIIESSMKVLIESSKKGTAIASQAVMNVSEYIKEMHRVDERLRDLMADEVSSMRSQVSFLTPTIAGIVIGITSMITKIIGNLGGILTQLTQDAPNQAPMAGIFAVFGSGIPTYFFQIIVGVYVVQIAYLLSTLITGIESGADKLAEEHLLGTNLIKTTLIYISISAAVILLFNIIAGQLVTNITL
ncbi:hypothetical protein D6783_04075 [Candidatus Woesearchaeota archaeon]|nr:MAG: hypothetical protein D6783_04075 [Candidatus Woesearchaeota archaeon]